MKVLLLHPADVFEDFAAVCQWDLVVDLGHAPASSYELWGGVAGCRVISLYQFEQGTEDLYSTRGLLQAGMGRMVDDCGIDWWDVLSLMIAADLQDILLACRVAKEVPVGAEIFMSRPGPVADALQAILGRTIVNLDSIAGPVIRRLVGYRNTLRRLDWGQLKQVLQDKFDRKHSIRRRLARRVEGSELPVVLLPSAYINVSRTAVAYASMLPEQRFLLMLLRKSAQLAQLPPNVISRSLDAYFTPVNRGEIDALLGLWTGLKAHLVATVAEFSVAGKAGILERIPGLLGWGIALRDAWKHLFELENVAGCVCADDSNPYTRIPLILAEQNSLPTLACHHGALDARMAMKTQHGDFYLAKGEMERDFLVRVCRVAREKVLIGAPSHARRPFSPGAARSTERQRLVFFTEPYQSAAWRPAEIYRDLLPRLVSLAQTCGLKLIFKVHPFESVKSLRLWLRKYLPNEIERDVDVIGGPATPEMWQNMRFAMTVQSTIALECAMRGIPVFLCAWLRDPYLGYIDQFARYGVGKVLQSADDMMRVPELLETTDLRHPVSSDLWQTIPVEKLQALLSRTCVADLPLKIEAVS